MDVDAASRNRLARAAWGQVQQHPVLTTVVGIVGVVGAFTGATSYGHERQLAATNGQAGWAACLIPFAVDGMVVAASIVLLWASWQGIRGFWRLARPRAWLAVGMGATIAANYFSDLRFWWLGPAVSASCGVSLVIISDITFWLLGEQRKLTKPDQPETAAACACPPPPLSLAEAVPLARAALQERLEPHGEQALADRFGTTRHEIRKVLSPPAGTASLNGASA